MPLVPYPARSARHLPLEGKALCRGGSGTLINGVLETISLALFHTAFPIQPPPLRGTSFHRKEGVSTRAPSLGRGCRTQRGGVGFLLGRRSRILVSQPSPLGRGTAQRRSGALVNGALETIFFALFHPASPIQPPPLRGTSFHRKEGVSTRAPSLGRGCRAQRGGVGFLLGRRSPLLFAFPIGKGGSRSGARVLS